LPPGSPEPKPYPEPEPGPVLELRTAEDSNAAGSGGTDSDKPEKVKTAKPGSISEDIKNEPILQVLIDVFDGEIL